VNIVTLKHTTRQVGLVRATAGALELLERRRLVAEGFEKIKGKSLRVEGYFSESGNGFFDFDCIHILTTNSSGD
jgi:hypothetical protein